MKTRATLNPTTIIAVVVPVMLTPAHIQRYFGISDENDHVVLDGGRCVGRIFLSPRHRLIAIGCGTAPRKAAIDPQQRIFSDTRIRDGEFWGAG